MATTTARAIPFIPGIHSPLTVDNIDQCNATYNMLPRIHSDMNLSRGHVNTILALFNQYGMIKKLGIHLLHRHDSLPAGQIKLETRLETVLNGKWNKPTLLDGLDLNNIDRTIFRFVYEEGRLVPYEFARDPSPVSEVEDSCIKDFVDYVTQNQLVDEIALQILDPVENNQPRERPSEVELGTKNGTVVLPVSMVKNPNTLPTGWSGPALQPNDPDPHPGPDESWQKQVVKDKETHKVFISQAENEEELLKELVHHGVIEG